MDWPGPARRGSSTSRKGPTWEHPWKFHHTGTGGDSLPMFYERLSKEFRGYVIFKCSSNTGPQTLGTRSSSSGALRESLHNSNSTVTAPGSASIAVATASSQSVASIALGATIPASSDRASVPVPFSCTRENHICGPPDVGSGCASCGRRCHRDCRSSLCTYAPCPYCLSHDLTTHQNSDLCKEAQMYNTGCHACGRQSCWTLATTCHAKCTRFRHVCIEVPGQGCTSCNKPCHATNADPRCAFFQRQRDQLEWSVNAQQLLDTQPGSGGSVPHMWGVAK